MENDIVRNNKLLADFTDEEIHIINEVIKIENYSNTEPIIVLGERNRDILTIVSGQVSVWYFINEKHVEVAKLAEGTIIGDMNFIIPTRRTANVSAIDEVKIIRFPYKEMLTLLLEHSSIANKFFAAINVGMCAKTNETIDKYKKKMSAEKE